MGITIYAVLAVNIPIVLMLLCMLYMSAAARKPGAIPEPVKVVERSQPRRRA